MQELTDLGMAAYHGQGHTHTNANYIYKHTHTHALLIKQGDDFLGAKLICKRFEFRKCHHHQPVSAAECIASLLGLCEQGRTRIPHNSGDKNSLHFLLATQDLALKKTAAAVPAVPVLTIHHHCLVLEKPSELSLAAAKKVCPPPPSHT